MQHFCLHAQQSLYEINPYSPPPRKHRSSDTPVSEGVPPVKRSKDEDTVMMSPTDDSIESSEESLVGEVLNKWKNQVENEITSKNHILL